MNNIQYIMKDKQSNMFILCLIIIIKIVAAPKKVDYNFFSRQ